MTRRRKSPEPRQLLEFIAEHESLALTCDEFPGFSENKVRDLLREIAASFSVETGRSQAKKIREANAGNGMHVDIFSDGACRGNPGLSAAGWVIFDSAGELLKEGGAFLGRRTNNEAEYEAVIHALQDAVGLGATTASLCSDSQLLVRQINGQYRIKNDRLVQLHRAAREVIQRFKRFDIRHIPREQNERADACANKALDDAPSSKPARRGAARRR